MIARLHYDFCDCDPNDPNHKGDVVEFWFNANPPPVAAFFGAPNKGCVIGPEFFAAESLNTLPGVGGTAEGVEPDAPNVNGAGAFSVSDFGFPVPGTAPKEKRGFGAGCANDIDLALPVSGAPNSVAELTEAASFGPDCPRLSAVLSVGLMPDTAGAAPFMAKPLGLPLPSTPNAEDDRNDGAIVVLEVVVLDALETGCTDGMDELIDVPKLNAAFGGLDGAGTAGGWDGEMLGGLFEIPKLNFGFCESLMPPAAGLEPLVVVVVKLEGCGNEKVPRGAAPGSSP